MNLSKNELLKMAINSKPKKEILEKKSKNELIEYVFGVKVNECSMKKINQSEKHLEKCSSIPMDFRNSSYIPPQQQLPQPLYNLSYTPMHPPPNDFQKTDFQKFLPTITSSIETIKKWNEEEKPNALKLLEDGKNIVSEWINIQRPFFENKLETVEKIWNNWERVDKPNIEKLLSEIRDTRSVIQNVDITLLNNVNQKVSDYLQVQKPNIESKYNEISTQFRQFAQITEQVRNENIKLLQLLGPIEQLRSLFQDATSFEEFKNNFEKQIQDLKINYEQQLSLSFGNEITQIGEVSLQLSQTEETISTMESDIIVLKSVFDDLKQNFDLQFKKQQEDLQVLDNKIFTISESVTERDSKFFEQFRTQWNEAFQKFLNEQSIRDLNYQSKQTLEFNNRIQQLQIENQQNLETLRRNEIVSLSDVPMTENQVDTTTANNEFFQNLIDQFREQWREAFQKFLNEQSIRDLNYQSKQTLEFNNRIQQLQIENQQNLETLRRNEIVPAAVNQVDTTTANNEFFQNLIDQFREQWREAFQKFLNEQSIRDLNYQSKQTLEFNNRIQQLQIENQQNLETLRRNEIVPLPMTENQVDTTTANNEFFQNLIDQFREQWREAFQKFLDEQKIKELQDDYENKIRNLTQMQVSNFREMERNIQSVREELPLALPFKSPLAIKSAPVKNLENAVQESNAQISILGDSVSELRSDNRKMNTSLVQISKDLDSMQRTNVNVIETTVNRKLADTNDQELNSRREQIKIFIQQELNNALPTAIQNAALNQTTQFVPDRNNINEIVKKEILKQKDLIRQIVIQVVNSEKKNVLSQLSKSPVNFRIQQKLDKLREENSRLQNIILSINSRLESVSSRLTKVEEPPDKKRKIPSTIRPSSVIVPRLPVQF